jgi:hypothetical protein
MPGMHVGLISLLGSGVQTVDDQFEAGDSYVTRRPPGLTSSLLIDPSSGWPSRTSRLKDH